MSTPHRTHGFVQHLNEVESKLVWTELASLDGHDEAEAHPAEGITIIKSDNTLRRTRRAVRLATKQLVRAIYLGPLLVLATLAATRFNSFLADMIVFSFVAIVLLFFLFLNLYLLLRVIAWAIDHGREQVLPHFEEDPAAYERDQRFGGLLRGRVVPLDQRLAEPGMVIRDLWHLESNVPWRITEAVDFVVVPEDIEEPHVVRLESAPLLLGSPRRLRPAEAKNMLAPSTLTDRFELEGLWNSADSGRIELLTLSEGDRVELSGGERSDIPDLSDFDLGDRTVSFTEAKEGEPNPYRGTLRMGVLVKSTPTNPVRIRVLELQGPGLGRGQ